MKTFLTTTTASGIAINHLLQTLRSIPIEPKLPSPHDILHNCIHEHPRLPSTPVDLEQVRKYLIDKKTQQKDYPNKGHRAQPLSDLEPR